MQADKWPNIKDILAEILEMDSSARRDYLDSAPITSETRNELKSLLAVEKDAKDFLSVPASGFSQDFFEPDKEIESTHAGEKIGVYEVIRELGVGGMGSVFLGERRDGKFSQQVAIKLLKREFNAGRVRAAFEREISILSKLVHPNIARMLDTGVTNDGIPYLVMEYVEGLPIDKYCSANSLPLKQRLKLFIKTCEAVTFAHQNLIVHRDLKPSNIIVTPDGVPKLLDFGISKLLDTHDGEATGMTIMGAMTPEYASPEQINGGNVSTATDVYSLGVVLFKLLTHAFPYNFKHKFGGDILREITDTEPTAPSEAISFREELERSEGEQETQISLSPFLPFASSRLKGDLDNIVLKALRKEPDARYMTIEQFVADIWRFIDGKPVEARASTFSYRANKFFRRNKIAVIAAGLVFLSLVTGLAAAIRQTNEARAQANFAAESKQAAELETEKAKTEQAKSEKMSKFMAKIISYANPAWFGEGWRFGGEAKVIDALLDLSGKIDTEFAGEPDVAAELHHKFSEVFLMVGRDEKNPLRTEFLEKRKFHALRALELRKQFYGERHELVAKDMWFAADYLSSNEREKAEIIAQAIQMMRETNSTNLNFPYMLEGYSNRLMMPDMSQLHEIFLKAAIPQTDENKYQMGERLEREALSIFRLHYPEDNRAVLIHECSLAYALAMQDKWSDFDEHFATCKRGQTILANAVPKSSIDHYVDVVEKALAEKNR